MQWSVGGNAALMAEVIANTFSGTNVSTNLKNDERKILPLNRKAVSVWSLPKVRVIETLFGLFWVNIMLVFIKLYHTPAAWGYHIHSVVMVMITMSNVKYFT